MSFKPAIILTITSLISSCSSYNRPESFAEKMKRYKSKNMSNNAIPKYKIKEFSGGRIPASATNASFEKSNYSNKGLYFLTLVSQYNKLRSFSSSDSYNNVKICPNFHTGLIKHYEKYGHTIPRTPLNEYNVAKDNLDSVQTIMPELSLPLDEDSVTPTVYDIAKNSDDDIKSLVEKGLSIHIRKTYRELSELCEYGSSDNYYIYENLITQINDQKFNANTKSLEVFYKTTIFSNMALIQSLNKNKKAGRVPASVSESEYQYQSLHRMRALWAYGHLNELKNR